MSETAPTTRVVSLNVKGVTIEIYPNVDETTIHADALIASVGTEGTWAKRTSTPINASIKYVAGSHFHDWLKTVEDLKPKEAVAISGQSDSTNFKNVVFVNGTRPLTQVLQAAMQAGDEKGWRSLVLPLISFADSDSQCKDDKLLLEIGFELGVTLENMDLEDIRRIKVVHPRAGADFSVLLANSIARGAAETVGRLNKGKKPRPNFQAELQLGGIGDFNLDAVVACVAPAGCDRKFAISKLLEDCAGNHYHNQLPRSLYVVKHFLTRGIEGQGLGFEDVIFVLNDGKKTVAEYVEDAVRFADTSGLRKIGVPLSSFIDALDVDEKIIGKVLEEVMEGLQNFVTGGNWSSLQLVKIIVHPDPVAAPAA